jgi:hypothetical protein
VKLQFKDDYNFKIKMGEGGVSIDWCIAVPTAADSSKSEYETLFHGAVSRMPDGTPPDAKSVQSLFAQAAAAVLQVLAVDRKMAEDPACVPNEIHSDTDLNRLVAKAHLTAMNKAPS